MKVTLVAVTKTRNASEVLTLPPKITIIAENRVQEAELKFKDLDKNPTRKFEKHFIGHLQSNKVKKAVEIFDVIQSIDSEKILKKVNSTTSKKIKIMLQVNISNDPHKGGLTTSETKKIITNINKYQNIELIGLMTILKNELNEIEIKNYYNEMNLLFQYINQHILSENPLQFLSMGMSDDYQIAIDAGSNMIRIGKALFDKNHAEKIYSIV